jgi:CRP-like cAMP-binding protein
MKEFAYIPDEGQVPAALRAVPLLDSFTEEQLDDVLSSTSLLQCDPGDTIIKEGTLGSRIYILLSGSLDVLVGGKKVTSITKPGDVFGELAVVNQDKRVATVVAPVKAACLAIDQKFLQDIHPREEDPSFHASLYEFVARVIARKLSMTSRRLAEVEKELRQLKEVRARPPAKSKRRAAVAPRKRARPLARKRPR